MLSPALAPLGAYRQWICYKLVPDPERPGKTKKIPVHWQTGITCDPLDPANWTDHATAKSRGNAGFVFTENDPFWFFDIDNGLQLNGQWSQRTLDLCAMFPHAAREVSQSGRGLHIIGTGAIPDHSCKNVLNDLEFYHKDRFCAITDMQTSGDASADCTPAIANLVAIYFPPNAHGELAGWTSEPLPEWDGPKTDEELIKAALASGHGTFESAFNGKVKFRDLWEANAEALAATWPGKTEGYGASEADMALISHLAFWTGKDCERIRRLMDMSALRRDKWNRDSYIEGSILRGCAVVKNVAKGLSAYREQRLRDDQRIGDDVQFAVRPSVITLEEAHRDFVFIGDGSFVASRTSKAVRKFPDAAKEYAASKMLIETGKFDLMGQPAKKPVPVLRLWLDSPNRLTADVVTWAPGELEFCHAPERQQGGERAYNLWRGIPFLMAPPDWEERARPFLQHVEYLVPSESERTGFLQWVAHIFQRPGELPHTAYLMVATETGIGRGTLASILTRALRGYVAANMSVEALFGGFNGRISQKLLATVDEVREGHSKDRYAKAEALKSKITEEIRALNPKYGVQSVEKNCCRWLMFSNHLDALPFDNSDRRIIVIANPTNRQEPAWYAHLHGLMNDPAFIASVQRYFCTLDLTGFNPHAPAPINEAKRRALAALESPTARACQDFAAQWPDDLATRADLVRFVGVDTGRALGHEIERAGMRTAHNQKVGSKPETVLIVRGSLTPEDLATASKPALAQRITSARTSFWDCHSHAG